MTQTDRILAHLQAHQSITPIEALELYGCFRLAARISDLREAGHQIETETVRGPNGKHWARYHLVTQPVQMAVGW
jgi:hypothetical protein